MKKRPLISVVVCTYNDPLFVNSCLGTIKKQSYTNYEVLCVDGMSVDKTPEVIRKFTRKDKRFHYIMNKNRLHEGKGNGKWLGFRKAKGEIIGVIDQDNILQDVHFFAKMVRVFEKEPTIVGVLGGLKHDRKDSLLTRYVALFGTDPFFAYRSVDYTHRKKGALVRKSGGYGVFPLAEDNMHLTGGNCFFYLKKDVHVAGGYDQDVLLIRNLIRAGKSDVAIINNVTKHYTAKSIGAYVKKLLLAKRAFNQKRLEKFNYLPKTRRERHEFLINFFLCIFVVPRLLQLRHLYKYKDPVIVLHPLFAFLAVVFYSLNFIRQRL